MLYFRKAESSRIQMQRLQRKIQRQRHRHTIDKVHRRPNIYAKFFEKQGVQGYQI